MLYAALAFGITFPQRSLGFPRRTLVFYHHNEVTPLTSLYTIASGSEGNCLLIRCGETYLLVDAGISTRRITTALDTLGVSTRQISGILLTHVHTDHTSALAVLTRHHPLPLYATAQTAAQIAQRCASAAPLLRAIPVGQPFRIGEATVTAFPTSHDAWGSADFRFDSAEGSIGILTDTGYVTDEAFDALCGVDLLVLESNHDLDMLRSGPYPPYLQERIAGTRGHLSNADAARFAVEMARHGTREFVLAHLSRENNIPALALHAVQSALAAHGFDTPVSVAPRRDLSRYDVEVERCRR